MAKHKVSVLTVVPLNDIIEDDYDEQSDLVRLLEHTQDLMTEMLNLAVSLKTAIEKKFGTQAPPALEEELVSCECICLPVQKTSADKTTLTTPVTIIDDVASADKTTSTAKAEDGTGAKKVEGVRKSLEKVKICGGPAVCPFKLNSKGELVEDCPVKNKCVGETVKGDTSNVEDETGAKKVVGVKKSLEKVKTCGGPAVCPFKLTSQGELVEDCPDKDKCVGETVKGDTSNVEDETGAKNVVGVKKSREKVKICGGPALCPSKLTSKGELVEDCPVKDKCVAETVKGDTSNAEGPSNATVDASKTITPEDILETTVEDASKTITPEDIVDTTVEDASKTLTPEEGS